MALVKPDLNTFAKIKVLGVGGGGNNAIDSMINSGQIKGVEFVAVNTDAQALHFCKVPNKILIGKNITKGLDSGMDISLGMASAKDSKEEISEVLKGSDMVFITCGFGGGTGSGAGPVIAEILRTPPLTVTAARLSTDPVDVQRRRADALLQASQRISLQDK